jgi:hypothetical protein
LKVEGEIEDGSKEWQAGIRKYGGNSTRSKNVEERKGSEWW